MSFNTGDLVQIVKQPPDQWVPVRGLKGFIDDPESGDPPDIYRFKELRPDGLGGFGTVAEDCLQPCNSPALRELKIAHDLRTAAVSADYAEKSRKFCDGIAKIAAEYGIPESSVRKIREELSTLDREVWG